MEQMNGNELRSVLIEKNLIDEAGTVNAFKVNIISGAHAWPLLRRYGIYIRMMYR